MSLPSTSASQGYTSYRPPCREYDLDSGSDGRSQMFPHSHFPDYGPSSWGDSQVTPVPPGILAVIWTRCSISNPPGPHSGKPGRLHISLQTTRFLMAVEPVKPVVIVIAGLPPLPEVSYHKWDADDERVIHQTWVVLKSKRQSVCSKQGSPRCNLANKCSSPTTLL